ncbi:alpha-amylase family glycosyl hydrolase [Streptomyces sp. NPDC005900]|uniref:alpha-amylase family glycosyl hydrolase n=1 Tax=Streptomyces sp. NPDC005900 TaxID=3154569 RepID=UPI0034099672
MNPARLRSAAVLALAPLAALLPATHPTADAAPAPPPPSDAVLAARPTRHDLTREQFYLVMPDRFANGDRGNDRGGLTGGRERTGFDPKDPAFFNGGDLKGITGKLDYIKGLGTTAIWLTPVFENLPVQDRGGHLTANYHGYAITDFTRVDPHFGTDEDLGDLIDKAHAKGMKVFFDVVTNHTADIVHFAENTYDYRSKGAHPYLDPEGRPFDDSAGMRPVDRDSFPYTPRIEDADRHARTPAWLNDPTMYHNRGESAFAGESGLNGDFMGNDDLWTERPEVVAGMKRIYERWVGDFGIDGFRVDTAKNVNMEFWTEWARALDAYAATKGNRDFLIFAEAFSADPAITAPYVTRGGLDATLDFPFQAIARNSASRAGPPGDLSRLYAQDYRYTTGKANAYEQVTFLGSHDMGRIGGMIAQDNPGAGDAELLRRDRLAHELMFLGRGNRVVYAGDEQGFTGAGGDNAARQPLFATDAPAYRDDDQIGTRRTHAQDAYDPKHPLYRAIARLSELTRRHPALRDGVFTERYAGPADRPGVYAYSRTDPAKRVEYVVAHNNATEARTVRIPTGAAHRRYTPLYGAIGTRPKSGADRHLTVTVPALSSLVLKADRPLPGPHARPHVTLRAPEKGATGTVELTADVDGGELNRVVFAAQQGTGPWQVLGTADHAPHKVTQQLDATLPEGTELRYKAVVVDSRGRTAHSLATSTAGRTPPPAPPVLERAYAVVHYQRPDGDYDGWRLRTGADGAGAAFTGRDAYGAFAWVELAEGATTFTYTVEKDGTTDGPARSVDLSRTGEVWIAAGADGQREQRPDGAYPPTDGSTAVLHYHRPDGDYEGWGLHVWDGAAKPSDWDVPVRPTRTDAFGLVFEVKLRPGARSLSHTFHKDDEKDVPDDEALDIALYGNEVWRVAGEPAYLTPALGGALGLDLSASRVRWLDEDTVVWPSGGAGVASRQLLYAPGGGITLRDGVLSDEGHWLRLRPAAPQAAWRHRLAAGETALTVDPRDRDRIPDARRARQLLATERAADGALIGATSVR